MPESSGNQRFVRSLIQRVSDGAGFIEDIWIERDVKLPGAEGEITTARSYTGNSISNITELLEDDLRHTFEMGRFTFRFVAANYGSGKTALLSYLHELIQVKPYSNRCVVIQFALSDLLTMEGSETFSIKLIRYILAQTFLELLQSSFYISAKSKAEKILAEILEQQQVSELKSALNSRQGFINKFNESLAGKSFIFEELFLSLVHQISNTDPYFTFVYLIDELDELRKYSDHAQSTRSVIRALIKRAIQVYESEIRLMIYMVGISEEVESFINSDPVLKSHVHRKGVITLVAGRLQEFEKIKARIIGRIEGAYRGYPCFEEALREIYNIKPDSNYLRGFCQDYADKVLVIHEKYFKDAPEKCFEGNIKQFLNLLKLQCQQRWRDYLETSDKQYKLLVVPEVLNAEDHTFDCYIKLIQNNRTVASAYAGARNYELLSKHFEQFCKYLKSVNFNSCKPYGEPPDLAFMIAPECSDILRKKLEINNIIFIDNLKETQLVNLSQENKTELVNLDKDNSYEIINDTNNKTTKYLLAINVNTANKESIVKAFKGARIRENIIDEIIKHRPYRDLSELLLKIKLTRNQANKLQEKLETNEICFQIDVFLCHNTQDKPEVRKIATKLKERGVSVWLDEEQFIGGDRWQEILEKEIESDRIRSAAVFIGKNGIGPWQSMEKEVFLERCVQQNYRVIPVILGSCDVENPQLPSFLRRLIMVDFRQKRNPEPLEQLIRSIQGR